MAQRITVGNLAIEKALMELVSDQIIPGTGVASDAVWQGLESTLAGLAPRNKALLAQRNDFQSQSDQWYQAHAGVPCSKRFLGQWLSVE